MVKRCTVGRAAVSHGLPAGTLASVHRPGFGDIVLTHAGFRVVTPT